MNFAASRLIRSGNNASLHNLILRPSAAAVSGASDTQLLNTVSEPQLSSQLDTEDPKAYSITLPLQKPSYITAEIMEKYSCGAAGGHFHLGMFGLAGVDQSGIVKIHTRRSDLTDDSDDSDFEDSEMGAFDDDDLENDDGEDFQDDDDDDFDEDDK